MARKWAFCGVFGSGRDGVDRGWGKDTGKVPSRNSPGETEAEPLAKISQEGRRRDSNPHNYLMSIRNSRRYAWTMGTA